MQSSQEANPNDSDQPNPRDLLYQFFGGENDRLVASGRQVGFETYKMSENDPDEQDSDN